jgi:hypothetical protein
MSATATIGPIGLLHRNTVRAAAFEFGVETCETRGLVTSTFTVRGAVLGVQRLLSFVADLAERQKRADHRLFVDDMEASERRRDRWARLVGRGRRLDDLSRAESIRALDIMEAVREQHADMTDEARDRLTTSIRRVNDAVRLKVGDVALGTFVSVAFRYLQHDVRTGGIELSRPLRRQVLGTRVTIDTWDD